MSELGRRAALGGVERHDVVVQPLLLDRENMAAAICIGPSLLDELKEAGLPSVTIPTTDKELFDPHEVVAWIKNYRDPEDVELTPIGQSLQPQNAEVATDQN